MSLLEVYIWDGGFVRLEKFFKKIWGVDVGLGYWDDIIWDVLLDLNV